ncbi:MAG TPA: hypothetical protein VGS27_21715 [Candidatus Sulfotelmatobacter sp.]|nr:hypothetical protein [Candidatus Sulfotelmatobacter sp.]
MPNKIVWHYTYEHNMKKILESQVLLPPYLIPGYVDAVELAGYTPDRGTKADRKLLLFSENEVWEPASYRGFATFLGVVEVHKLEDYADYGCAVFRIGVETNHLKPYLRLCRSVGMPKGTFDGLWKTAVEHGSNPYQWWGTTKPIPMSEWVSVEVYANGIWNDCFPDEDAPAAGMEATQ